MTPSAATPQPVRQRIHLRNKQPIEAANKRDAWLRLPTVMALTGKSRSGLYAAVARGDFPKPMKDGGSSFWVAGDVTDWMAARVGRAG